MFEAFYHLSLNIKIVDKHSWAGRNKLVRHENMEPLVYWIVHTFNKENQNKIDERNENILKQSSLSTCIDLVHIKNTNLASLLM